MGIRLSPPGLVCCAGSNREEYFTNALHGNQGGIKPFCLSGDRRFLIGRVPDEALSSLNSAIAANPILEPFGEYCADSRLMRMAITALEQVRGDVEAAIAEYGSERVGVCIGCCDNGSEQSLTAHRSYFSGEGFPAAYDIRLQSASLLAEFVADFFGIKGPCLNVATACASSAGAILKSAQLIESGLCDAVISGGADLVADAVLLGFAALEAVSDEICNPFSKNRKGITLGEGAVFYCMRKGNDAPGHSPDIELLGWGESADAYHMTAPRPDGSGAQAAMQEALNMAGLAPGDVDYINLHGTGTPLNDSMEALAIQAVFADKAPPISSTKPITGHTLGAAGALELALCWMALAKGGLPAHCWDGQRDETMPSLNFVAPNTSYRGSSAEPKICMSNSFAFGGCNTSLIIGRGSDG